jgi:hypothetical protein
LVKNSFLDINKKNRNDQEPGTILTGIFTEKGFINKNVSLKNIHKSNEEPISAGFFIAASLNKNSNKTISRNTIIKYLEFLTNSYIIYAAPRYDIKGKELLSTNPKYYLVDLGLKNITTTNKYDADLGRKLENVVYFELLRRGGKIYAGKNNDKEIDFVVQKPNNEREYYQIAFTVNDEKTFEREISAFRNIRDNYPKFLLTLDFDNTNIEGIHKVNVIDWLLGASHSP